MRAEHFVNNEIRGEKCVDFFFGKNMLGDTDLGMDVGALLTARMVAEESCGVQVFIEKKCFEKEPAVGTEDADDFSKEIFPLGVVEKVRGHHVEDECLRSVGERESFFHIAHRKFEWEFFFFVSFLCLDDSFVRDVEADALASKFFREGEKVAPIATADVERRSDRPEIRSASRSLEPAGELQEVFTRVRRKSKVWGSLLISVVGKAFSSRLATAFVLLVPKLLAFLAIGFLVVPAVVSAYVCCRHMADYT